MHKIDITLFMSMKDIRNSGQFELDFTDPSITKEFNDAAKMVHIGKKMPRYWGFASYQDKHNQASLIANPAIVLEYAYAQRQQLQFKLKELGLNALIFNADRAQQATVVVVLPLENPITSDSQTWLGQKDQGDAYTRAATVIADMIGIYDLIDGKANTFLVQPAQFAKAQLFKDKALSAYHLNRAGWMEFKDWQKPKPYVVERIETKQDGELEHLSDGSYRLARTKTKTQEVAAAFRTIADYFDAEGF